MRAAARAKGRQLDILEASTASEIEAAFANLVHQHASALVIAGDPLFFTLSRPSRNQRG
jgi:hypothetical protein